MHKLRINPLALKDLQGIKKYITKELDNSVSAVKVVERIIQRYEKLRDFPTMGVSLSSNVSVPTNYRFLVSGDYIIFYKVENDYISIYRILNVKRDYLRILLKDGEGLGL